MTPYYPESNVRMVKNICNLIYVLRSRLLRVVPCVFYVKSDIDPAWKLFQDGRGHLSRAIAIAKTHGQNFHFRK